MNSTFIMGKFTCYSSKCRLIDIVSSICLVKTLDILLHNATKYVVVKQELAIDHKVHKYYYGE